MNLKENPELIPLIDWWEKDGKQTVICVLVAVLAVGGWYGWKAHRAAVKTAASSALVNAYTTEELEDAVNKFSGSATSGALKLRLAKSYFDANRYEEAMAVYEGLSGKAPDGFEDIPVVGKAQCLEALGRFAEAEKAFADFATAKPKNYLTLTAQLGAIRCQVQGDKKAEALKAIAALKEANKEEGLTKARIEQTEDFVKRYEKPAEAKPAEAKKPAEAIKPAEAKPAEATKPAEAKKPAENKPAEAKK